MSPHPKSRPRTLLISGVSGFTIAAIALVVASSAGLILPAQSAGAAAGSAQTITAAAQDGDIAHAPLPDLAVTVSQTENLVSQGIKVSWTGGKPSSQPTNGTGGENFLQMMQCWGDEPGVVPAEPDRTTCTYGSFLTPGATRDNFVTDDGVAPEDMKYTAPGTDSVHPTYTSISFRAPVGAPIESVVDNKKIDGVDPNTNAYFTALTSNEVKWAGSGADGSGSVNFEVQTVTQSSGMDCGKAAAAADGSVAGKSCWLVIVPRGVADVGEQHIVHSALFYASWKHRIAFRMGFHPIGSNCAVGAAEKQLSGSELMAGAVASWQPTLCAAKGGSIYTISQGADSDALKAANDPKVSSALALASRPFDTTNGTADSNLYAPVALSGAAISFAIDRQPKADGTVPADVLAKTNQAFATVKLTPRLVAKLLTNSYLDSLPGDKAHLGYVSPGNPGHNASNLTTDPDFLAINDPEWKYEALTTPSLADLLVPQGRSDVAWQLWRYVVADPSAKAFLDGAPDQYGMIVNPWSATTDAKNASKFALVLPTESFPKSDPTEVKTVTTDGTPDGPVVTGPINLVTWRPYTIDYDQGAYLTLRGDGQVLGPWDTTKATPVYAKTVRNNPGFQGVLGLTDTASAARYQVVTAQLLNPAGAFVGANSDSMAAAGAAMTATKTQSQVYEFDPAGPAAAAATAAYPLTMPVYAATNPAQSDAATRASYAAFIRYAATTGQTPGPAIGQLPDGYAPLPASWQKLATDTADAIQNYVAPPVPDAPTDSTDFPTTDYPSDAGYPSSDGAGPDAAAAGATGPNAAGAISTDLLGAKTPKDPATGGLASVIPLSLLAGLLSAAAVPIVTRIRRRF